MATTLTVDRTDHIATLTLTGRTMPPRFFEELGETFAELNADPSLRAVVIHGSERCFSYGLDLPAAMGQLGPLITGAKLAGPRSELRGLIRRWQADMTRVAECPVPTIAAISGWCIGGGLDLAAACDIRLCSADARFSLRETRIAIVADLGSLQRLPAIIGQGHTRELAFTGGDIDAARAQRIGLVNDVLEDRAAAEAAARAMAEAIAQNAPLTVRGVKEVLDYGLDHSPADGLRYVAAWNAAFLASEDLGEAVGAFAQKRPPRFQGR